MCVATVALQCEIGVRRDKVTFCRNRVGLGWSVPCRNMIFCVATVALQWEAGVSRNKTFSVKTELAVRCRDRVGRVGGVATSVCLIRGDRVPRARTTAHDRARLRE